MGPSTSHRTPATSMKTATSMRTTAPVKGPSAVETSTGGAETADSA